MIRKDKMINIAVLIASLLAGLMFVAALISAALGNSSLSISFLWVAGGFISVVILCIVASVFVAAYYTRSSDHADE